MLLNDALIEGDGKMMSFLAEHHDRQEYDICLAILIKKQMIQDVAAHCITFLGQQYVCSRLGEINDPLWWISVKDFAPTVLFHCAIHDADMDNGLPGGNISLADLPSYSKSLFPPVKRLKKDIVNHLKELGYDILD